MAAQAIGSENGIRRGNVAVTFPAVYSSVYKAVGPKERMYPSMEMRAPELPVGVSTQAMYHQQKKVDADRMAIAKVQSTRNANNRANVSHAGYFNMPRPVLGQRKFANQSLGAYSATSGRRDTTDAPFHFSDAGSGMSGGVLRSMEGQAYGKKALVARISQLNAIDAAKQNFTNNLPAPAVGTNTSTVQPSGPQTTGENLKIEINFLLKSVDDALEGAGDEGLKLTRFTYQDAYRLLTLIFRFAPSATGDELARLVGRVSEIVESLDDVLDPDNYEYEQDKGTVATAISLQDLMMKMRDYLRAMVAKADVMSEKEKTALSRALVVELDFKGLNKGLPRNVALRRDAIDLADGADFSEAGTSREDSEQGSSTTSSSSGWGGLPPRDPRAMLNTDYRQAFGYRSGAYYPSGGRDAAAFFGEEAPTERQLEGIAEHQQSEFPEFVRGTPYVSAARGAPARRAASDAPSAELRAVFDPDTQAFNVRPAARAPSRGETDVSPLPSSTSSDRRAYNAAMAAEALPTTRAQLTAIRTMADLRALAERMTEAGVPHRIRPTTTNVENARKNIAKKLGITWTGMRRR